MFYIKYQTDGFSEIIETEKKYELKELQEAVGGMIEFAPEEDDGSQLMVNKEWLLEMLPPNPFFKPKHQDFYAGTVLQGRNVQTEEGTEFVGFETKEDAEFARREIISISPKLYVKGTVITIISIGDFMAQTTRGEVVCTGESIINTKRPIFKENKKGAKKKFGLRNIDSKESLVFEGTDLPFEIDGKHVVKNGAGGQSSVMRCNALINLYGDINVIREYVHTKNLNPFFTAWDRINHIADDNETETLIFTDVPSSCKMVDDKRANQLNRKN